ncbi:MAG: hypothetical protein ACOCU6_02240 [Nanoarchaeota archaeon]
MDIFEYYMKEARRFIDSASHLKSISYKLSGDPELFAQMLEKIHKAHQNIVSMLLVTDPTCETVKECAMLAQHDFDMAIKRIENNAERIFSEKEMALIKQVHMLVKKRERSPVEFPRKDSLILCNDRYDTEQISIEMIQDLITQTQLLLKTMFSHRTTVLNHTQDKQSQTMITE